MDMQLTPEQLDLQQGVRKLCSRFPEQYWNDLEEGSRYPEEFVEALSRDGWLGVLIPSEYGGGALGVLDASIIIEEINASGCNAACAHAQMYTMGTILRHGSEEQKVRYLPEIAAGTVRLQAFGVTEPVAGSDTGRITTTAERSGSRFLANGQKIWTSRANHSDLMLLLARTSPVSEGRPRTEGLSAFILDMRQALGRGLTIRPIRTMLNHDTNEVFFDNVEIPEENLIGEEGQGFRYILSGMNVERILVASEAVGDGRWFIEKASAYGSTRVVFDRPIAENQGVQFPIARAYANVMAAQLMCRLAASRFDLQLPCGAEANMAKLLASEASWEAANVALDTHGGFGFAREFSVERKFRETRLFKIAPVSNNLVLSYLAQHVLGMPRSY
jgi:acyl-CoA dehydrogenase